MDTLPIELRIKILRYFDIEVLLSLEYKDEIMWEILHTSSQKKTKTWLIDYVSNFGIIYIKDKTDFGLYNDYDRYKDNNEKFINLWDSKLPEGFYKLRFLFEGFDLVKIGNYFLSSQDGPLESFNELEDKEWGTSYISRGFELVIKVDNGLSFGEFDISSRINPLTGKFFINDIRPTFYIVYPYNMFQNFYNVEVKLINEYSSDSVYNRRYNRFDSSIKPYIIKDVKSKEVIGYKLQTGIWSAYDVTDIAYCNEGADEFSVSWYRYSNKEKCTYCGHIPIKPLIGFIITGSQNDYSYPGIIEYNSNYPDKYLKED